MPALTRYFQKQFANLIAPSGNIGKFGSLAAGTPQYAANPSEVQSLAAFQLGWTAATVGTKSPALEDMNGLFYLLFHQLAYLFQAGVAAWNSETTYFIGQFCSEGGKVYKSLVDDNLNVAVSNTNNWIEYTSSIVPPASICKSWVCFDGSGSLGDCTLFSSYNILRVEKLATGCYMVYFNTPLANNNYSFSGTTGTADGQAAIAGDNNVVCGGTAGPVTTGVKTTSRFFISTWNHFNPSGTEDSGSISVQVFASP